MDQCCRCKKRTNNTIIQSRHKRKDGSWSVSKVCNPCNTKRVKDYYHRAPNVREALKRSIAKHREKQNARDRLNYAVRMGLIRKPKRCTECKAGGRIEGHHPDHRKALEVIWLCRRCHMKEHRKCSIITT